MCFGRFCLPLVCALFAALALSSERAEASLDPVYGTNIFLGGGALSYNSGSYGASNTGSSSAFTSVYPEVSALVRLGSGRFQAAPSIAYTLFPKTGSDGTKSRVLALSVPLSIVFDVFDFRVGPGVLWYSVYGTGGSINLPDGGGTASFALPDKTTTSRVYSWDLGLGCQLSRFRLDLDALIADSLTGRRTVSYALGFTVGVLDP